MLFFVTYLYVFMSVLSTRSLHVTAKHWSSCSAVLAMRNMSMPMVSLFVFQLMFFHEHTPNVIFV